MIIIREAISALKYSLAQNAIETQKQLSIICEWKMRNSSADDHPIPVTTSAETNHSVDHTSLTNKDSTHGSVLDINQIACDTTVAANENIEPLEVSQAREELATLVGEKQRMEARQRRLEKRLSTTDSQLAELQKVTN